MSQAGSGGPVNFEAPPVTEVLIGVSFDPVEGLSSYRAGALYERWRTSHPLVSQQPELPPNPPLDARGGMFLSLGGAPAGRLWFETSDRDFLIQLQSDRLVVNWRRTGEAAVYPRFPALREHFVAAWRNLAEAIGEDMPQVRQIEVTYVNSIPHPPSEVVRGWNGPMMAQGSGSLSAALDARIDLEGGVNAIRRTAVDGSFGESGATSLTLTVMSEPSASIDFLGVVDASREHIVKRFKEITDERMHLEWGDLD